MKICILISSLHIGGSSEVAVNLVIELSKKCNVSLLKKLLN